MQTVLCGYVSQRSLDEIRKFLSEKSEFAKYGILCEPILGGASIGVSVASKITITVYLTPTNDNIHLFEFVHRGENLPDFEKDVWTLELQFDYCG